MKPRARDLPSLRLLLRAFASSREASSSECAGGGWFGHFFTPSERGRWSGGSEGSNRGVGSYRSKQLQRGSSIRCLTRRREGKTRRAVEERRGANTSPRSSQLCATVFFSLRDRRGL